MDVDAALVVVVLVVAVVALVGNQPRLLTGYDQLGGGLRLSHC
jgi:hypothetical protein